MSVYARYFIVGMKLRSFNQFESNFAQVEIRRDSISENSTKLRGSIAENVMSKYEREYYRLVKEQFAEDGGVKVR